MGETRKALWGRLFEHLQAYGRIYTFRDPNNASLFDLRVNECYVLDFIVENGPISVTELAQTLGVHKSNASRIARALQERGHLETAPDPEDKRSVVLRPTPQGKATQADVKAHFVDRLSRVLSDFSESEVSIAMRVLAALTDDAKARVLSPDR